MFSPGPLLPASLVTMPEGGELGNIVQNNVRVSVWGGSAGLGAAQQLMEVENRKES